MADFAHLRRVIVSQRLTRGRRDFNTAALDFRAQQHLLSKMRVLNPDYAVKVLSPEEQESEKRIPGGHIKTPEIRYDPKGVRQPGQILKLHVTAEEMMDDSEQPNFGWVDPPPPVSMASEIIRQAAKPQIRIGNMTSIPVPRDRTEINTRTFRSSLSVTRSVVRADP